MCKILSRNYKINSLTFCGYSFTYISGVMSFKNKMVPNSQNLCWRVLVTSTDQVDGRENCEGLFYVTSIYMCLQVLFPRFGYLKVLIMTQVISTKRHLCTIVKGRIGKSHKLLYIKVRFDRFILFVFRQIVLKKIDSYR